MPKREQWSQGRLNAFIASTLRSGMRRWPAKWEALESACVGSQVNPKSGRKAKHYRCAGCQGTFITKDIETDHVTPVVDPTLGFTTWDDYIKRLFCEASNLQVLCKPCHKAKSKSEASTRASVRKSNKLSEKEPSSGPLEPLKKSSRKTPSKSGRCSRVTRKRTSGA